MPRYLAMLENTATGFSAYAPGLPGCVATGATRAEVEREMREAVKFHVEGLRRSGYPVPEACSDAVYWEVAPRKEDRPVEDGCEL